MTDEKYKLFAQDLLRKEWRLSVESANKILEECFKICNEVTLYEDSEFEDLDEMVVLSRKVRFLHAFKTVYLNEIGVDIDDIKLFCAELNDASASFKMMPNAFGKKVSGVVEIDVNILKNYSYFELARTLFHEFNHIELFKEFCEGKEVPTVMGLGSGCLTKFLPLQVYSAYMANKNERLCNLKSHVETKKWLNKAKSLHADDDRLKVEARKLRVAEKTDNATYLIGNLLLGRMWEKVLKKIIQLLCKILDNGIHEVNGVELEYAEEDLKKYLENSINCDEYDENDLSDISDKALQLLLPKMNIGLDEYMVSFEDCVEEVRIVDFQLSKKSSGINNIGKLKYHVILPTSYLKLSPEKFFNTLTKELERLKMQADEYNQSNVIV